MSEDPADGFRLIGEAYVHGIMYGEALANGPLQYERMEVHWWSWDGNRILSRDNLKPYFIGTYSSHSVTQMNLKMSEFHISEVPCNKEPRLEWGNSTCGTIIATLISETCLKQEDNESSKDKRTRKLWKCGSHIQVFYKRCRAEGGLQQTITMKFWVSRKIAQKTKSKLHIGDFPLLYIQIETAGHLSRKLEK